MTRKVILFPVLLFAVGVFLFSKNLAAEDQQGQTAAQAAVPAGLPDLTGIVRNAKPCVVNVSTTKKAMTTQRRFSSPFGRDPFSDDFFERFFEGGPMASERKSLGSGFVINDKGHILTNRHVIVGADEVIVHTTKKYKAKIVGEDDKTDIAVLEISAKEKLPYCAFGNSDSLQIGEWVIAMGNPFGLESTVTVGIVSAKGRVIGAGPYDDFIQTDASINPGNSGGPLFNLKGEVVGINTAIVASGQGIGFAIPINLAKDLIPQLITKGRVTRGWLGVGIQDMTEELSQSFGLGEAKGVLVSSVFKGSPAEKGGLKEGDVIIEYDGIPIKVSHDLPMQVARTKIGKTVNIVALRDGKKDTFKIKIGKRDEGVSSYTAPPSKGEGLGISVRDIPPEEARERGLADGHGGVYITGVEPGSRAASADIRGGDILISINGKKIPNAEAYAKIVKDIKDGQIVRFFVRRGDMTIFFAFTK